jgi:hypothetical protein
MPLPLPRKEELKGQGAPDFEVADEAETVIPEIGVELRPVGVMPFSQLVFKYQKEALGTVIVSPSGEACFEKIIVVIIGAD